MTTYNRLHVIDSQKLQACIHCGLCLEHCPTYLVTGEEMSSPRGRIYLMKAAQEGRISPRDEAFVTHEESCVVCRSCETACPSGVEFGIVMEQTRELITATNKRNWLKRVIYTKLLGWQRFTRLLQYPLSILSKTSVPRLFQETFSHSLKRISTSLSLLPTDIPFPKKRPQIYHTWQQRRGTLGLLIGCIGDIFTSRIMDATIFVLNELGYDVHTMPDIPCCGALASHAGFGERAGELAGNAVEAIESTPIDYFITNIAGCGAMMKDYPKHFTGTVEYDRATEARKKMRDISEFLLEFHRDDLLSLNLELPEKISIGYQAPCHLYHGQQIKDAPMELLRLIRDAEVFPLEENDICCGSAGTHNIEHPEMGEALLERKMAMIKKTIPDRIATANAGCLMQIASGIRKSEAGLPVQHAIEILAEAMKNSTL